MISTGANEHAGYHQFHSEAGEPYGGFNVYWHAKNPNQFDYPDNRDSGWYWAAGFPGCLHDGEPSGPFETSRDALHDADEFNPVFDKD